MFLCSLICCVVFLATICAKAQYRALTDRIGGGAFPFFWLFFLWSMILAILAQLLYNWAMKGGVVV